MGHKPPGGDGVRAAVAAAQDLWAKKHAAVITATVAATAVGAGCLVITGGAGSVGCAAATFGAVDYAMSTPPSHWTIAGAISSIATNAAVFAVVDLGIGAIGAGVSIVAKAAAPLIKTVADRVLGSTAKEIAGAAKPLLSRREAGRTATGVRNDELARLANAVEDKTMSRRAYGQHGRWGRRSRDRADSDRRKGPR